MLCQICRTTAHGLFKRTDSNGWAHMLCALWLSGLAEGKNLGSYIMNSTYDGWAPSVYKFEPITAIATISANRWTTCRICGLDGGACVRCKFDSCKYYYHALCGLEMKGLMENRSNLETGTISYPYHHQHVIAECKYYLCNRLWST